MIFHCPHSLDEHVHRLQEDCTVVDRNPLQSRLTGEIVCDVY